MQSSLHTLHLSRAPSSATRLMSTSDQTAPAPLPSDHLLQGRKIIEISHNGTVYRLQATKLGKLILTKYIWREPGCTPSFFHLQFAHRGRRRNDAI